MNVLNITSADSVCTLELNRPEKRNALNDDLITALKDGLRAAEADDGTRAVVIKGAGKDFCSGADLSALQKIAAASLEENLEDARSLGELYKQIRNLRLPVIAAVRGRALAGGCGLAMACDVICAESSAVFGYPEVKIGFVPAMVAAIVRRNMSEKQAFTTLTGGFEFSAADLKDVGIVHAIFEESNFDEGVGRLASRYGKLSRTAVEMTKQLLYELDGPGFDEAIELGAQTNAKARMTKDCQNGIAQFLQKQAKQ